MKPLVQGYSCGSRLDIIYRVFHGSDSLHVGFRNFNVERFLEGDDQLNGIQTVGAKIIDQASLRDNNGRIKAEMATDNQHDLSCGIRQTPSFLNWSRSSTCNMCMLN